MDTLHTADNLTFCTPYREAAPDALWPALILTGRRLRSRFPSLFLMELVWYCRKNTGQGERRRGSSPDSVTRRWCVTLGKLLSASPRLNFLICKLKGLNWTIFSELDISFLFWILRFPALHCPTTVITYVLCNCVNVGMSGWEFAGLNTEGGEHLPTTFACLWHICVLRRQSCGDFEMTQP